MSETPKPIPDLEGPAKEPFEMRPMTDADPRGWDVIADGEKLDPNQLSLRQERLGIQIELGWRPEGYQGPVISERGGGGAVTVPYLYEPETDQLYIGMIDENRPTTGGRVLQVPRGMLHEGESHKDAGSREHGEETGHKVPTSRLTELARGVNSNSTYFDTSRPAEDGGEAGVRFYGVRMFPDELEEIHGPDGEVSYVFPEHVRNAAKGDPGTEHILGSVFLPSSVARTSQDMFTAASVGYLESAMREGRVDLIPPREHTAA